MPRLTRNERTNCIRLLNDGFTQMAVANIYGVSQSMIQKLKRRFDETGDVNPLHGGGRPRKIGVRQERILLRNVRINRTQSARKINDAFRNQTRIQISNRTVTRTLKRNNLRARRRAKCIRLLPRHRTARLEWVRDRLQWRDEWKSCLFTDETRFNLIYSDGRILVWREPNSRYAEENMVVQEAFGGGGLTVWGGVMWNGKTEIFITQETITAQSYRNNILLPIVIPYAEQYGNGFVLIDDNARPHRARIVNETLEENNVHRMDWPAKSPDLNLIENVWSYLKLLVVSRPNPSETLEDLAQAIQEEWENIPRQFINDLVLSMPNRCQEVANIQGGPSRY